MICFSWLTPRVILQNRNKKAPPMQCWWSFWKNLMLELQIPSEIGLALHGVCSPYLSSFSRGRSSSDHSRIGMGYLATFFFIYFMGSRFTVQGSGLWLARHFSGGSAWRVSGSLFLSPFFTIPSFGFLDLKADFFLRFFRWSHQGTNGVKNNLELFIIFFL